jgi:hypothetical protein
LTYQNCRICGTKELVEILDLGFAPPSNALLSKEDLSKGEIHYPLTLLFCQNCKLVQTRDFHSGEALFTPDYPYLSSTSRTWTQHAHNLVDSAIDEYKIDERSLVAEIASNDGYLLDRLHQMDIPNYGIEPTRLAAEISLKKGHNVYNCFLNLQTAKQILNERGAADLIIANNVFAHVPNLRDFTESTKLLLAKSGILIIEVQYFGTLFKELLFDTIYHEHYSYFTLASIKSLLGLYNLGIFRAEIISTHGGSIRIFAKNNEGHALPESSLGPLAELETNATRLNNLIEFQGLVNKKKKQIKNFFWELQKEEKVVAGLGAAAKGNTLINFVGLGRDDIAYVFDSALSKQGKYLPGSHIPILPFTSISNVAEIDTFVALPWNIAEELKLTLSRELPRDAEVYKFFPEIIPVQDRER